MAWLGRYRLIAHLGRGGMADVKLALVSGPAGSGFSKLAVVKRLRANVADDAEFVTMLLEEARITAQLRHHNVVQTLEVGTHDGEAFLAMEYLDGLALRRLRTLASRAGVEIPRHVELVVLADVLAGLHHAHELVSYDGTPLCVVHRDVTPHNIFVTVDGQVKVLDFGIAKAAVRAVVTQHGMVKGKIRYMSPEQAAGNTIERRSDLFSVGILLWEALTKRRFWEGFDDHAIGSALLAGAYNDSPRSVDPSIPAELDAICRKALALDPKDRFATAEEFRVALETALGDDIVLARRQLGPLVTTLAEADRAKLRAIIEKAAAVREPEGEQAPGTVDPKSGRSTRRSSAPPRAAAAAPPDARGAAKSNPPPKAETERPRKSRSSLARPLFAAAALAAVLILALVARRVPEHGQARGTGGAAEGSTLHASLAVDSSQITRVPLPRTTSDNFGPRPQRRSPVRTLQQAKRSKPAESAATAPAASAAPSSAPTTAATNAAPTTRQGPSRPIDTIDPWFSTTRKQ